MAAPEIGLAVEEPGDIVPVVGVERPGGIVPAFEVEEPGGVVAGQLQNGGPRPANGGPNFGCFHEAVNCLVKIIGSCAVLLLLKKLGILPVQIESLIKVENINFDFNFNLPMESIIGGVRNKNVTFNEPKADDKSQRSA